MWSSCTRQYSFFHQASVPRRITDTTIWFLFIGAITGKQHLGFIWTNSPHDQRVTLKEILLTQLTYCHHCYYPSFLFFLFRKINNLFTNRTNLTLTTAWHSHLFNFGKFLYDSFVFLRIIAIPSVSLTVIIKTEGWLNVFIRGNLVSCEFSSNFPWSL